MKNNWIKLAVAVATAFAVTASVQATPISGSIGFTGVYVQNGGTVGDLLTATSMSISSVSIQNPQGVFVGATTPTFASPIGVNGNGPTLVGAQLWSVIIGGVTYKMIVNTETQNPLSTSQTLALSGTGTMEDGTPADNTTGVWQISFGVSGSSFTWQSTSASVPDGASTAMLLGLALSGVAVLKRKFMA